MPLKAPHGDWRLPLISPLDVRAADLDAVLTRLWLRIEHGNRPLTGRVASNKTVAEFAMEIEAPTNHHFRNFTDHPGAAEAWLRADLIKTLKRKPDRSTVARPVHALATRLRSDEAQTKDSNASVALFAWLSVADKSLITELKRFISVRPDGEGEVDLSVHALALMGSEKEPDVPRSDEPAEIVPPLCLGQAKTYADDLRRLLAYEGSIPRAALIDHIRRLTGLHLGLYLLRVFRLTTEAERGTPDPRCRPCASRKAPRGGICPHDLELLVDCGEDARSPMAELAEESWRAQEDILAQYVRSHLALKKLDEFGRYLEESRPGEKLPRGSLSEIAAIEHEARPEVIGVFFDNRIDSVVEQMGGHDPDARVRELVAGYRAVLPSSFRTYVGLLAHYSERRWFSYHRQVLDYLWAKNLSEGLLRQPLGGGRRRRGAMGASLLETLTLIAVVAGEPGAYYTRPLQVDELIGRLEHRYGMRIASAPAHLAGDVKVPELLAANVERFKSRLRETGLFTDLSDAFLAQRVKPRHNLGRKS